MYAIRSYYGPVGVRIPKVGSVISRNACIRGIDINDPYVTRFRIGLDLISICIYIVINLLL